MREDVAAKIKSAPKAEGTRLCIVENILQEDNAIKVYTSENLCSAGEEEGSLP